jgi:predicted  nucleic acid-binding Zn-ribbon protein
MPHKCARCDKVYSDTAPELIKGCACGSRVFLFMKGEDVEDFKKQRLVTEDLDWIEKRLSAGANMGKDKTLHLDVENLLRIEKGKYRLNIASLMKGDPLVVKVRDGVYYIDIPYSMKKKGKKE